MTTYIHELPDWPTFRWSHDDLLQCLAAVKHRQGRLIGRLFNAATAQAAVTGAGIREEALRIAGCFDSVSVCLSKGLGAPVGSVLCGSREFIGRAHRIRKMAGGGMRQAGILAAEGSYALDHHLERLAQDHFLAQRLTDLLDVDAAGIDRAIAAMNAFFTA